MKKKIWNSIIKKGIAELFQTLFGSIAAKLITYLGTVVFLIFSQIYIANWQIEKRPYTVSSHVKLSQQLKETREDVVEAQSECGKGCYVAKISIEPEYVTSTRIDYIIDYFMVYGYDFLHQEYRDVITENEIYREKEFAGDTSILIEETNSVATRCRTISVAEMEERKLKVTVARLKRFHPNIDRLTACIGHDRFNNVSWAVITTFTAGVPAPCGNCIAETNSLRNKIEKIWNL